MTARCSVAQLLPSKRIPWLDVIPGAIVTVALFWPANGASACTWTRRGGIGVRGGRFADRAAAVVIIIQRRFSSSAPVFTRQFAERFGSLCRAALA